MVGVFMTPSGIARLEVLVVNADSPYSYKGYGRLREHGFIQIPDSPLWEACGDAAKDPCYGGQSKSSNLAVGTSAEQQHGDSEHGTTEANFFTYHMSNRGPLRTKVIICSTIFK